MKTNYFLLVFLFIFWSIFSLVWGRSLYSSFHLVFMGTKTSWTIIDAELRSDSDGGTTYAPVVRYYCNQQWVEDSSNFSSSSYPKIWKIVDIYCDPLDAHNFIIDDFGHKYFWLFFFIPGLALLLWIIIYWIRKYRKKKQNAYLKKNWNEIIAEVSFIGERPYKINWRRPYYFVANYLDKDFNESHSFESENFYFYLPDYIIVWDRVTVYVIPPDFKKYYIETGLSDEGENINSLEG